VLVLYIVRGDRKRPTVLGTALIYIRSAGITLSASTGSVGTFGPLRGGIKIWESADVNGAIPAHELRRPGMDGSRKSYAQAED